MYSKEQGLYWIILHQTWGIISWCHISSHQTGTCFLQQCISTFRHITISWLGHQQMSKVPGGKKKIIKLCSCVTSIACSNSILNFKIEVQNSTCTRDRLNYGHIMQTLPHSLCSFHYPHGKKITRLRVKDDIPLTLTCLKHLFFVFNSDPFIAGTG